MRESVDITRLSHIVRGHMAAGGATNDAAPPSYNAAQATGGGDVQLEDADAELVFHDQAPRGTRCILYTCCAAVTHASVIACDVLAVLVRCN